nr:hypothetical protein [Tanacetum cinerariifolium]
MTLTKVTEQMTQLTSMCEMACQFVQKNLEEKQLEEEQAAKAQCWKLPICYDDDDDEEGYNSFNDNIISELPSYSAVTPTEPIDSLSMGDEHLDTIPATKSNEFINIEDDDDDSERDIPILKELLDNYSLSLPANESYHFDIPSPYRPPAKPPDGNAGTLSIKMMGDVSDQKVKLSDLKQALRGRHP